MHNIIDLLNKKRQGQDLTWEEIEYFIRAIQNAGIREAQAGALLMTFQVQGINDIECELLMKAMLFSGERLNWPPDWDESLVSLQSTGTTGNKAKVILAPMLAACGIKCPILSARGVVSFGGVLGKLATIPGFTAKRSFKDIRLLLSTIGCCVVEQPQTVAPAERIIRDTAALIGAFHDNNIKAACLIARVTAMHLHADVIEITYGQSEVLKTKDDAIVLVAKLKYLRELMGLRCRVLMTHIDGPVGTMTGQSLEIQEAIWCLNGDSSLELTELVCTLGGHALHEARKVETFEAGKKMCHHAITSGSAKKKFCEMLFAQGVSQKHIKDLMKHKKGDLSISSVLPKAKFLTQLTVHNSGFVQTLNTTILNKTIMEFAKKGGVDAICVGGVQLSVNIGSYLTRGETWATVHHQQKLEEDLLVKLNAAIQLRIEAPLYDCTIRVNNM